jgi:DNA invertase Pin-like site-specific DNA recombinase/predicted DNA-binding transcriptional regulator AlpA
MVSGSQKVGRAHLERLAIVYLRQSSPRQVRENVRSTERQYGLADKAAQLGWEPARVLTVDGDLGISGRGTHAREAYKELVGRVCLGEVGAIFGLEVARLARNNAELLRLLEFCAVTDTIVVDTDGIYDLKDFNDRTILGLKAQWSEAELHIMASRLQGAKRHAAERGELRLPLPIGYVYDADGDVIIDPDEEVQAAVSDLFKAFTQTGSAYGVVGAFKDRRFPKRIDGVWEGELCWERLRYSRVRQALTNPTYAGAYAFGRHSSRRAITPDGTILTKKVALPRAEWTVLIHDHHPAYISWDAFLANEARLAANHTCKGQRPAREGGAICQGIILCGSCGRTMGTHCQRGTVSYKCARSRLEHLSTPGCSEVKADAVDELVARRLLHALAPEEIALALAATDEVQERRARANRALELRVERARYQAIRAERAFHACEPDNRLVARSLETRWETKLRELKDAEAELAEHVVPSSEPSRAQIEALAHDLPALWAANSTSHKDRKRLLRAFINDATLTFKPHSDELSVGIRWRSGANERHTVKRPERDCIPKATLELIARLAADHSDAEIGAELQAAGRRSPRGRQFNAASVKSVRHRHKIPQGPFHRDGELRPPAIAKRLELSESTIYDWIRRGTLQGRRGPGGRLWVQFGSDVEQECRERIANSGHITAKTKDRFNEGAV